MKRVAEPQVSPDAKWIVYTVTSYDLDKNKGNTDLWLVPLAGGESQCLLNSPDFEGSPRWSPDSTRIAFLCDTPGITQIFTFTLATRQVEQITKSATDIEEFCWAPDGKSFLFVSMVYPGKTPTETAALDKEKQSSPVKARVIDRLLYRHWNRWTNGKFKHVFIMPATGGQERDLTPGEYDTPPISLGGNQDYVLSPDGGVLYFVRNADPMVAISVNNDIFSVNVQTGELQHLTTRKGNDFNPILSPDGRYLAYLSMEREGFEADKVDLMLLDLKTKKTVNLTESLDRDVENPQFSPDGFIYFTAINHYRSTIFRVKIDGAVVEKLVDENRNTSLSIASNGRLVFLRQAANLPAEIFTAREDGKDVKQITFMNASLLAQLEMNPVEDFWFESFDGWRVQGILVKPPHFQSEKKYPGLLLIHGGPQGEWSDEFHYRWNLALFAAKGYVVLGINPRGSKGYGQKFCDAVSGDWGGAPYQDLMAGVDAAIQKYPFLDANKIGAAGASYGGYMINWIAGHTTRFQCLITHAGLFEMISKYGSTEELWFPEWEFRGTPYQNPELYHRFSPSRFASNFKTPTLVTHGEQDFRVPIGQALQMFTALQRQGIPSRLLYFPDEGHFIAKPQNAKLWWNEVHGWLAKWLK